MSVAHAMRVLVVDDNAAIHADFAKILTPAPLKPEFEALERLALGVGAGEAAPSVLPTYELTSAFQGTEALDCVRRAVAQSSPFALAFVDMRMPPGWDGLQTIEHLWAVDSALQIVICSAFSDYDWDDALERLKRPNNLLVIKKPFDAIEVLQSANALTGKWQIERELHRHLVMLEQTVALRTAKLEESNEQLREQMRLRQVVEAELALAQKLEAVGRLASGIAHEINTPIQYISDSVHFLGTAFDELLAVINSAETAVGPEFLTDLVFLREEVPLAIERTIEGTQRVATIVRAMKDFAHPDSIQKTAADLNRAIETTLLIARNEYKYVATVDFRTESLPEVVCNVGELSQVFLNLIVNSSHALADAGRDTETGRITVRTRKLEEGVELCFEDNGCGIPPAIIDKIYDPFFTTKEVGRGSGQGLAIVRAIVVDKHAGRLSVVSTPDVGTCFTVWLPT
jgi:two-component system NtrC family sensor kinase